MAGIMKGGRRSFGGKGSGAEKMGGGGGNPRAGGEWIGGPGDWGKGREREGEGEEERGKKKKKKKKVERGP